MTVKQATDDTSAIFPPYLLVQWMNRSFKIYPKASKTPHEWIGFLSVDPLAKSGPYTVIIKDPQGKTLASTSLEVSPTSFKSQAIQVSKSTAGLQAEAGELERVNALKQLHSGHRYWSFPLQFQKPVPQCMNSPFGVKRIVNGQFTGNYHKGIDQKSPQGQVIVAPEAGKVVIAKSFQLHGGTVGLDHGQGISSIYIHMSQILVKEGMNVQKGQAIGKVGSTGFAAGPHLHWGVFINSIPINPVSVVVGITPC